MNKCCMEMLQKLQDKLNSNAEALIKIGGKGDTVMEMAALKRADIIIDVMAIVKEFSKS